MKKNYRPADEFFKRWNKLRNLLYRTPEYQNFLIEVRTRANWMCESCGRRGREVHHIVRVYDDPAKSLEVGNAKYLCLRCHKKEHK